jgi:hypothetical protein
MRLVVGAPLQVMSVRIISTIGVVSVDTFFDVLTGVFDRVSGIGRGIADLVTDFVNVLTEILGSAVIRVTANDGE